MDESLDPEGAGMASEICFVQASSMRFTMNIAVLIQVFILNVFKICVLLSHHLQIIHKIEYYIYTLHLD